MECMNNLSYRSTHSVVKSDSESSDSEENSCDVWKRISDKKSAIDVDETLFVEDKIPVPPFPNTHPAVDETKKRKTNNIWSNVMHEQTVSDDLGQFGLVRKPENAQDRSCESYDFSRKLLDTRGDDDPKEDDAMDSDIELDDEKSCAKYSGPRNKSHFWHKRDRYTKLDKDSIPVAKKIIRILNEKKTYLIFRIVSIVGPEKALELVKMTEEVEGAGGMLVKNNSRRRTPGGVYLQLLKADKSITKEMMDKIFADEINFAELKKLRMKKKKKGKKKKSSLENSEDMDMKIDENSTVAVPQVDMAVKCLDTPCDVPVPVKESLHLDPKSEDSEIEEGEIQD